VTPPTYHLGVKNRWILGDLDHLMLRLARSARALDLPDGAPSTPRALLDFLKVVEPRLHYEVLSASDWRPFAHELRQYLRGLCGAVLSPNRPPVSRVAPALQTGDGTARIATEP
jgi:hypothetical protein